MMRPHAPLGSESDTESDYDDLPGLVSQSDSSDSDSDDELQLEREDPEPELELEDPEPELELEDPEPELELEEPGSGCGAVPTSRRWEPLPSERPTAAALRMGSRLGGSRFTRRPMATQPAQACSPTMRRTRTCFLMRSL